MVRLSIGTSRAHISLTAIITSGTPRLGCELTIDDAQSDYIFERLQEDQQAIEDELGELDWRPLPDKKSCRIAVYEQVSIQVVTIGKSISAG